MQILPFVLNGQKLKKGVGFPDVVEKSKGYLKMYVSGIEPSYSYTAYFTLSWENNKVYSIPMSNGECIIDEYITTIPENPSDYYDYKVSVSVVGTNINGARSTSNFVDIILDKSNYTGETENTPEIPQSQYEMFVEAVANSAKIAQDAAVEATVSSESATSSWSRAENASQEAVAARDEAKEYAKYVSDNWQTAANAANAAIEEAKKAQTAAEAAQVAAETAAADSTTLVAEADAALQEAQTVTAELKRQAANAITADLRGGAVRVDDISPLEHPYTVTVEGENIIPYPFVDTTMTENGISFTDNGDGTVTISGSREDTSVSAVFTFATGLLFPAGTYVLSGNAGLGTKLVFAGEPDTETGENSYFYSLSAKGSTKEVTFEQDTLLNVYGEVTTIASSASQRTFAPQAVRKASDATVYKYGKNLLPYPYSTATTEKNGITLTDNGDGSITLNGTATAWTRFDLVRVFALPLGTTVALSGVPLDKGVGSACYITMRSGDTANDIVANGKSNKKAVITQEVYDCFLAIAVGATVDNLVVKPQVEIGGVTDWVPYTAPQAHTVTAEGMVEGLELLSAEDVTLVTDTADTVVHCTYNRDTNKVIEELVNAIISLGGNV